MCWSQIRTNLTICPQPHGGRQTTPCRWLPILWGPRQGGWLRAAILRGVDESPCVPATACSDGVWQLMLLMHQGWRLTFQQRHRSPRVSSQWGRSTILGLHPRLMPALGVEGTAVICQKTLSKTFKRACLDSQPNRFLRVLLTPKKPVCYPEGAVRRGGAGPIPSLP